jgi:hypothetical protein
MREGLLRLVGRGPRLQVELASDHPLARPIQELFLAEERRVETILRDLQQAAATLAPDVSSVWIQGGFATSEDKPGDPIVLGVLADSRRIAESVRELREKLRNIETTGDITIEIVGYSRPDLDAARASEIRRLSRVITIFGPPPLAHLSRDHEYWRRHKVTHADRAKEQLLLAERIAERLTAEPFRLASARKYIARRLETASEGEKHALHEWELILRTMPVRRLKQFLTDPGERAERLRQTLPFLDFFSPEEREELLSIARRS